MPTLKFPLPTLLRWAAFAALAAGLGSILPTRAASLSAAASPRPLNVLLILADDLGWSDLSGYGGDLVETPHLDRFAADGVRFTDAYAMPVCSPSRAMLLTGKHAARLRMTIWSEGALGGGPTNRPLLHAVSVPDLPLAEKTLAEHFQDAGYFTALIGKWHLGDASHFPETQGFDVNLGGTHWGAPPTYFWPYRGTGGGRFGEEFRYVPHLGLGRPGEYLTDRLTDETIALLRRARKDARPWFLFLAHYAPHSPFEAKTNDVEHFQRQLKPEFNHGNPTYAAMVKSLDDGVGRVLRELHRSGQDRDTVVVFASDNGGFLGVDRAPGQPSPSGLPGSTRRNAPLRAGKGWCYEGGIRVPLIIRWPGLTTANAGTTCAEPVLLADLFPTLLAAAARPQPRDLPPDGVDLRPLLRQPTSHLDRPALFFHYPHYYDASTPVSAVRAGPWKLLEFHEDQHVELYRLDQDLGETRNLADTYPDRTRELLDRLRTWRTEVGAAMPSPNPHYRPAVPSTPVVATP